MAQPARAPGAAAGAGAGAAVGAAGGAGGVATVGAGAAGVAGGSVVAAGILAGLIQFLAAVREQHRRWLSRELGRYARDPGDIAAVVSREMALEVAFARNSADRVAAGLPAALAIADPAAREAAIRALLKREEYYAGLRTEAMVARAIAALGRADLRRTSPLGAFWKIGHATDHTEGCLFMNGRFWPWAVLDRIHPPRHYGCTSVLHSYADALLAGWMTPSDVPDTRAAVRLASGVVMEADTAEALLAELDVRDLLLEQGVDAAALSGISYAGVS